MKQVMVVNSNLKQKLSNLASILAFVLVVGVFLYYIPFMIEEIGFWYPLVAFGIAIGYLIWVARPHLTDLRRWQLNERGLKGQEVWEDVDFSPPLDQSISRDQLTEDSEAQNGFSVPLLGTIATGEPIAALDKSSLSYNHETIQLTSDICEDRRNIYALRVKGDSMIDALINDGDIVIMRYDETVHDGEMVAVWLKDEGSTTLKRFYQEGDRVRLQPANPTMDPIYVDPKSIKVQGKVVAVVRNLN